jgi:hypothetical protein
VVIKHPRGRSSLWTTCRERSPKYAISPIFYRHGNTIPLHLVAYCGVGPTTASVIGLLTALNRTPSFLYRRRVIFAMAGAGKSCANDQSGSSALSSHNKPRNLPEGFDGPSDAQSNVGRPSHGFGAGVGYDPARDNPAPVRPQLATLFELPAGAYRDPSKQVSYI